MSQVRATVKMAVKPEDVEEARGIFEVFVARVRSSEPGVLGYSYYVDDARSTIQVQEHYADAATMLDHLGAMDQDSVRRLLEIADLGPLDVSGETTPELREALAGFGAVNYWTPLIEK